MKLGDAKNIAINKMQEILPNEYFLTLVILDKETVESSEGWYFYYQDKRYIETGSMEYFLIGTPPIFVSFDGSIVEERRSPVRGAGKIPEELRGQYTN